MTIIGRGAAAAMLLWVATAAFGQNTPDQAALIAALRGGGSVHEKARACQQLAAVGTAQAVPALAALLPDAHLGAYARCALEAIPDPAAGAALRRGVTTLRGGARVGAVASLGARRDPQAVPLLAGLSRDGSPDLASAAIAALGQIGSPAAITELGKLLARPDRGAAAADALLAAGDRLRREGKADAAARVFERVRAAALPTHVRLGAAGRLLAARQGAGVPLLVELLRSNDEEAVQVGLAVSREMSGAAVTRALAAELSRARPGDQERLLLALRDRKDPAAPQAIAAAATAAGAPELRAAAIAILGEMGRPSSVPVLVKAAAEAATEAEWTAAESALARMPGRETDAAIVTALPGSPPAGRARLIGVLERRRAAASAPAVLRAGADPDARVRQAAFKALVTLGRPEDVPEIIRLALAEKDVNVRDAALGAAAAANARVPNAAARVKVIEQAYAGAGDAAAKAALLRMLGQVGTYDAYRAVRGRVDDADDAIRLAAVQALSEWDDATPAHVLLTVARAPRSDQERSMALRGAIRLAGEAAEELGKPSRQVVAWLGDAAALVGADAADRRLLLSAAGSVKSVEGLALVRPYLADPTVEAEALQAVVRIAAHLAGDSQRMARSLLAALAAGARSDAVRAQADAAAKQIAGDPLELKVPDRPAEVDVSGLAFRPLFDGRSFDGWEGAGSQAFRIQDGAIVGGSLAAGMAQNEFMCTTRPYGDFVLRLECKVVNANGGVQIRSLRVPGSSEVCGYQADMVASGEYWGCLYDESRRGMLVQADRAVTQQAVKPTDWNAYEIRCEGPRIRLYVNGVLTADYTEKDPEILQHGIIGLQVHAGGPSETWYRGIQIADVP